MCASEIYFELGNGSGIQNRAVRLITSGDWKNSVPGTVFVMAEL